MTKVEKEKIEDMRRFAQIRANATKRVLVCYYNGAAIFLYGADVPAPPNAPEMFRCKPS